MTNTPEKNVSIDDKQNLLISVLKQRIIYDEANYRKEAWEQISAETGISESQCKVEWEKLRKRMHNHKAKHFPAEKMNWNRSRDFMWEILEMEKIKKSPSAPPTPSSVCSPSSSSQAPDVAPKIEPNSPQKRQPPNVEPHRDAVVICDVNKLVDQFMALNTSK